ncbi:MAG: prepilin peptidase [Ardenticatenia bacterium]|nr:prepilin peptidase [Ardenticatenia bacterium]
MLLFFLLGLLVAVGLSALADLMLTAQLRRPGRCRMCNGCLRAPQLIVLLRWLACCQRCGRCGAALPRWRALVEVGTGLFFALTWRRHGMSWPLGYALIFGSLLIVAAITDLEERRVPDAVVAAMAVLSAIAVLHLPTVNLLPTLVGGGVGFLLFLLIAAIRPGAMGAGDVKLAGAIGLISGFPGALVSLCLGIVAGGLGALILLLTRRVKRSDPIPYAPFLVVGTLLALISGVPFPR